MIAFLRVSLLALGLLFTFLFGETLETFLFQVVRTFVSLDPSNAIQYNLIHAAILLFPLALFAGFVAIATIDDAALRRRSLTIVYGMLLGLAAFRLYQVWSVLQWGVLASEETAGRGQLLTSGNIFFLEKVAPFVILGGTSALIPALSQSDSRSILYAGLASLCLFAWLLLTKKLPPGPELSHNFAELLLSVSTGIATGILVKKIREF